MNSLNHMICWDTNYCNGYYCDNGILSSSANLSTFYFRPYGILLKTQYIQCTPLYNTTMTNAWQNIYHISTAYFLDFKCYNILWALHIHYVPCKKGNTQDTRKIHEFNRSNIQLSPVSNEKKTEFLILLAFQLKSSG